MFWIEARVFGEKTLGGGTPWRELTWTNVVADILGDAQLFAVRLLTHGKSGVLHLPKRIVGRKPSASLRATQNNFQVIKPKGFNIDFLR